MNVAQTYKKNGVTVKRVRLASLHFKIKLRVKLKMQTRSGTQVTIRLVGLLFL